MVTVLGGPMKDGQEPSWWEINFGRRPKDKAEALERRSRDEIWVDIARRYNMSFTTIARL